METQTHEASEARRQALKAKIQIYDMDAHVIESDDDLRPLMPEPFRNKQGPLLGMDEWHVRVRRRPRAPGDLEKRLSVMKDEGIVYSLLFPSRAMDVGTQRDKQFAGAFCRAYNDSIGGLCREAEQLKAVALLPFQDVPAAVAELKRAVTQFGLSGVVLSSFGLKEHIGSTTFWPIYEEMERLNVPLMIHARFKARRETAAPIVSLAAYGWAAGRYLVRLRGVDLRRSRREIPAFARGIFGKPRRLGALLDGLSRRQMGETPWRCAAVEKKTERLHDRWKFFLLGRARRKSAAPCT